MTERQEGKDLLLTRGSIYRPKKESQGIHVGGVTVCWKEEDRGHSTDDGGLDQLVEEQHHGLLAGCPVGLGEAEGLLLAIEQATLQLFRHLPKGAGFCLDQAEGRLHGRRRRLCPNGFSLNPASVLLPSYPTCKVLALLSKYRHLFSAMVNFVLFTAQSKQLDAPSGETEECVSAGETCGETKFGREESTL